MVNSSLYLAARREHFFVTMDGQELYVIHFLRRQLVIIK